MPSGRKKRIISFTRNYSNKIFFFYSHLVHMRDLLCFLKVALDEPQDNIVNVLDTFIVDGNIKNDDIKAVSNFFTNIYLKSPEDIDRDIVLQLLKAITNQAFVAPAYWALKTKVRR